MHLVPRSFAAIATLLPLRATAPFFAVGSSLLVALLSLYVYGASKALLRPAAARAGLAGLMVLLPAAGFEATNNVANLHYPLMFSAFWALVARPRSPWQTVTGCAVVLAASMSDPATALFLPVAVWSWLQDRRLRSSVVPIAFALGLAIHGLVFLTGEARYADLRIDSAIREDIAARTFAPRSYAGLDVLDLPGLYGLRVAAALSLGDWLLNSAWRVLGVWLSLGGLLLPGALLAYALIQRNLPARVFVLVTLAYSIAFFAFPVTIRGTEHLLSPPDRVSMAGSRFVIVPMLFLATAMIALLATKDRSLAPRVWTAVEFAAVVLAGVVILTSYRTANPRSPGPRWSSGLAEAAQTCRRGGLDYVRIAITPSVAGEGFNVLTRCDRLLPD